MLASSRPHVLFIALMTAACGSTDNDGAGGASGGSGTGGSGASSGSSGTAGGGTSGSGGNGAAPNCAARCGAPGCPACAGPPMIDSTPQSFEAYRIDSTEVTNAHYAEFLATNPAPSAQPTECGWNSEFTPESALPNVGCSGDLYDPVGRANHPVVCVDWCDARAYCEWAGKRLCLGAGGTPTDDLPSAEWRTACSAEGTQAFPYGNTYDPGACNGDKIGTGAPVPVGSMPGCEGALPGLFDMSGNVQEWTGTCEGGGADATCTTNGGSFNDAQVTLTCTSIAAPSRSTTTRQIGFRCCADAID